MTVFLYCYHRSSAFGSKCGQQQSVWQLQSPAHHDQDFSKYASNILAVVQLESHASPFPDLIPSAYAQKPQLVHRQVLPVIWHHVSSRSSVTGETKVTLQELCAVLQGCMGSSFLESAGHLSVEEHRKLEALLEQSGERENR